jgi:hypothetical protein
VRTGNWRTVAPALAIDVAIAAGAAAIRLSQTLPIYNRAGDRLLLTLTPDVPGSGPEVRRPP